LSTAHKTPNINLCVSQSVSQEKKKISTCVEGYFPMSFGRVWGVEVKLLAWLQLGSASSARDWSRGWNRHSGRPGQLLVFLLLPFFIYRHYKSLVFKFSTFREKNFQWPTIFNSSVVFTFTVSYLWHVYSLVIRFTLLFLAPTVFFTHPPPPPAIFDFQKYIRLSGLCWNLALFSQPALFFTPYVIFTHHAIFDILCYFRSLFFLHYFQTLRYFDV
jgi:hypothetical protein